MVLNKKFSSRLPNDYWIYAVIFLIVAISSFPAATGYMVGEDESLQIATSAHIWDFLVNWKGIKSIRGLIWLISSENHPPLRFFLSLPGYILFPKIEFGPRLFGWLTSFFMTYKVIQLGKDIGGKKVGFISGFLVACSAIFNWTSLSWAWSLIVVLYIYCIQILSDASLDLSKSKEIQRFRKLNLILLVLFLMNTGHALFVATTGIFYFIKNFRRWRILFKSFLPFAIVYALYYGYFLLFFPWFVNKFNYAKGPIGQLFQNMERSKSFYLSFDPFIANLRGLNAYFFPYLSWILFGSAILYLFKKNKKVLLWFAPYLFAWSFYIFGKSQQYFLLVTTAILPFAVQYWATKLRLRTLVSVAIAFCLCFGGWNYIIFLKKYNELEYPERLLEAAFASAERKHNIVFPFPELGKNLDKLLDKDQKFIHDIDGAFTTYYYSDRAPIMAHTKFAGSLGSPEFPIRKNLSKNCFEILNGWDPTVRAVITRSQLCESEVKEVFYYPKSPIKLYVLKTD